MKVALGQTLEGIQTQHLCLLFFTHSALLTMVLTKPQRTLWALCSLGHIALSEIMCVVEKGTEQNTEWHAFLRYS